MMKGDWTPSAVTLGAGLSREWAGRRCTGTEMPERGGEATRGHSRPDPSGALKPSESCLVLRHRSRVYFKGISARRRPGTPARTQLYFEAEAPADGVAAERSGLRRMHTTSVAGH